MTVGKLVGRYEIITELGRGGFAVTFLAADKHLPGNPYCVVKQLQPLNPDPYVLTVAKRLFDQEAQILYSLGLHDQIPRALAYFQENEQFYIVQEYIEGQDLTHEIIPGKQLSETYVVTLLQDILEILRFVHENNFIHRDIKPANLIRRKQDGKIVIIDFFTATPFLNSRFDSEERAIGTPGYMPPEQMEGHPQLCSDIYAVGIIGIQALTGIHPRQFQGDINTHEIVGRNQGQVSKKLATILDKMVKYDYRNRYQSVDEILKALDNLGTPTTYIPKEDNLSENPVQFIGRWVQRFFRQKQENSNPATEIAETSTLSPVRQPTLSPVTILQTPEKVYEIVQTYIQEEHFDRALATAQQIPDEQKHLEALTKVIQAVSKLESNRVLELLAPLQNNPNERVRQLVRELQFTTPEPPEDYLFNKPRRREGHEERRERRSVILHREGSSFPQPQVISRDEALTRIEFVKGDLLDLDVDALVNPTGLNVRYGGAISLQFFQRLGSKLYEALRNQPPLRSGEVFLTDAGSLLAHYIIHTPTEENEGSHTTASIVRGVSAALAKADSLSDVQTIAFPSVGSGAAGFHPDDLAPKVLKAVTHHLKQGTLLKKVIFAFVDETAYQAYASAYQMLLLETGVAYNVSVTIPQETINLGEEIEIAVNLNQAEITQTETYTIQISHSHTIGSELNIFLTAPGFEFNGDNTTSLPLDPDTTNITQTASFNLTALRPGKTKIKAELYCGDTYKTTLETEVEVTAFEETELRPLIAARSRPVPQPDFILQVRTAWKADISACTLNFHIDSYQPRLLFADDVDHNSQSLSAKWVERSHSLLKTTLEEAASSLPGDFRSRLVSLGQYLFQSLLPEELQNTFRTIASLNHPFTLLILADQDAWFPWELLHDGQKFLGDRFIIGRWLWELEKARPYEFPVGAVNVAHYASVEQPELWTELLHSSGAPPPIPMQAGVFNDMTLFESIRGLHLIRYGQYVDTTNRQDAPVRVNSSSNIEDIEREVQPAKLSLRRNHPLVSLSYLNAGQPELTALEQTWASTFVRAGCSAFVGSLWAVQPNVEAAFVSAFYHSIWAGQTLGVAFQTARRLAKTVVPESLDWLAYVLFGDPMARPYRPVQGQGYAVVEPIGQEIDDPVPPGSTVRFRVSLRRTPPVWYENRLMEVAEDLTFDDLRVFIVTSGLQVTPDDSIVMTRTATGDYLGWFTLTVPAEMEGETVLVQVHFEDGMEPVHGLRFSLKVGPSFLPNYSQPRQRKRPQRQKQSVTERGGEAQ
ncbi:MAG: serine/threonine-protein kinase [Stigonema ocellatum SAG 48.90 = DSM 106950]|nr:serine/threonine-protein kinase [Stigonema ocellatum SAG 48.90 = DSM 106950]